MNSEKLVIFDGDDTLWKMQELYEQSKYEFEQLLRSLGIKEENIISKFDTLDANRVCIRGFTVERFFESMLIVYAQLSYKYGLEYDFEVEKKIKNIIKVIKGTPALYEDTLLSLNLLNNKVQKILLSAGESSIQKSKIKQLDLNKYFDLVKIVPSKNEKCLNKILKNVGIAPNDAWLIGNSPVSDILPALKVGINAILIARGTWKYDEQQLSYYEKKKLKSYTVNSLSEATNIVLQKI